MGYKSGTVAVGSTAVPVCRSGLRGSTLQNQGDTDVWVGTTTVSVGNGILLPGGNNTPLFIPGSTTELKIGGGVIDSGQLYAICEGSGTVGYICETTI